MCRLHFLRKTIICAGCNKCAGLHLSKMLIIVQDVINVQADKINRYKCTTIDKGFSYSITTMHIF